MTPRVEGREPLYDVMQQFVERCLRSDGSLFTPGRQIWTLENAEELRRRVVEQPDFEAGGDFIEKLKLQMQGATSEEVQLAAELLYLHLASQDFSAAKKRQHVQDLLAEGGAGVALPARASEALEAGIADYGAALAFRYWQYSFLVRFVIAWKQLESRERQDFLDSPDGFQRFLLSIPSKKASSQVWALLHLLFPDSFEPVVSVAHKEQIAEAFREHVSDPDAPTDHRLREIRQALEAEHGSTFHYYEPWVRPRWAQPTAVASVPAVWTPFLHWTERLFAEDDFDEQERDYKLRLAEEVAVARRALEEGGDWQAALRRAFTSRDNNLVSWRVYQTFLEALETNAEGFESTLRAIWFAPGRDVEWLAGIIHDWPADSRPGSQLQLVPFLLLGVDPTTWPFCRVTVARRAFDLLGIPAATAGDYELDLTRAWEPEDIAVRIGVPARRIREFLRTEYPREAERRGERWGALAEEQVVAVLGRLGRRRGDAAHSTAARYFDFVAVCDQLLVYLRQRGVEVRDRLDAQGLIWWLTSADPPDAWGENDRRAFLAYRDRTDLSPSPNEHLHPADAALEERLLIPAAWLQRNVVDLLAEKRQVIFFGPPGTGKTYVAQALAEHLTSGGGRWELVQFHPSYSYEDFFEGYRPSARENGALSYELKPGVLRRLAAEARSDPSHPYILIVDEINRGNLPKIFGELLFLLEYRDRAVPLQYSPDDSFSLPENLYVIGTMNTADRSIALVDAALRRRFYFVPFMPRETPVSDLLRLWLEKHGHRDEPALLLEALNDRIAKDEIAIGPSYLITGDGSYPNVERVWRHAIMPVLEEHFYGAERKLEDEFGLAALRKAIAARADIAAVETEQLSDE